MLPLTIVIQAKSDALSNDFPNCNMQYTSDENIQWLGSSSVAGVEGPPSVGNVWAQRCPHYGCTTAPILIGVRGYVGLCSSSRVRQSVYYGIALRDSYFGLCSRFHISDTVCVMVFP